VSLAAPRNHPVPAVNVLTIPREWPRGTVITAPSSHVDSADEDTSVPLPCLPSVDGQQGTRSNTLSATFRGSVHHDHVSHQPIHRFQPVEDLSAAHYVLKQSIRAADGRLFEPSGLFDQMAIDYERRLAAEVGGPNQSQEERAAAALKWMLLPNQLFRFKTNGRLPRKLRRNMMLRRMEALESLTLADGQEEVIAAVGLAVPSPEVKVKRTLEEKNVDRCVRLVHMNDLQGGIRALSRDAPVMVDDVALEALDRCVPTCESPAFYTSQSVAVPRIQVDGTSLEALIKRKRPGAAPGLLGQTPQALKKAMKDPVSKEAVRVMVEMIVNGDLEGDLRAVVKAAQIVPVRKKSGGVRPVSVPNLIERLAAGYLMQVVPIGRHLLPQQFAYGKSGAAATAAFAVQAALEAAPEGSIAVFFDLSNAFNTVSRDAVYQQLVDEEHLHPLLPYFRNTYGEPTVLVTNCEDGIQRYITTNQGLLQGNPLSPVLFDLVVRPILRACQVDGVQQVVVMDDICMVGEVAHVSLAVEKLFSTLGTRQDLSLNRAKCKVMCLSQGDGVPREVQEFIERHQFSTDVLFGATTAFGAPVGLDEEARAQVALTIAKHKDYEVKMLCRPDVPAQVRDRLLRWCVVPQSTYLLRCTPPAVGLQAALHYRANMLQIADRCKRSSTTKLEDGPFQVRLRIQLPLRFGGLGLTSPTRVAPLAFLAGAAAAAPFVRFQHDSATGRHVTDVMRMLAEKPRYQRFTEAWGSDAQQFFTYFRGRDAKGLQHALSTCSRPGIMMKLGMCEPSLGGYTIADQADWVSAAAPESHLFLTADLSVPANRMCDVYFHVAWAVRAGLDIWRPAGVGNDGAHTCPLCEKPFTKTHPLICAFERKGGSFLRHEMVASCLATTAGHLGYYVKKKGVEMPKEGGGSKRLDVMICGPSGTTYVDVSGTTPSAPSYQAMGAMSALAAATAREKQKTTKYKAFFDVLDPEARFVPFVFESPGAFGTKAKELIKDLEETALSRIVDPEDRGVYGGS
jgi:hypothetical protein